MRLFVAALLGAAGIGQSAIPTVPSVIPTAQSAIPTPQSAIGRLVTIDVTVTDARGRAVNDLKAADFELREGSTRLPLESVRLVHIAIGSPAEPPRSEER